MLVEKLVEKDPSRLSRLSRNEYMSYDSTMIYHMGIIDFLQDYNFFKKCETFLKTNIYLHNEMEISCVSPDKYRKRFVEFMKKKVLGTHKVEGLVDEEFMSFDDIGTEYKIQ
jgi:hypothetical protein